MTLTINANYTDQGTLFSVQNQEESQKGRKTFFAGNTNLLNDPVAQKRKEAQQKAMKVVKEAWANDTSVDKSVNDRRAHYMDMQAKYEEAQASLNEINQDKDALKEAYGITADSQEQKDLELLEKRQDYENGVSREKLTKAELARLEELDKKPLTEYQTRALELNDQSGNFKKTMADAKLQMADDVSDIKKIAIERLKSSPMVDATKAAEAIMEAANEEIIGMLMQEAKEHIDEKLEEVEEKAEEKAEEKEAEEEKLEDLREIRALQEAVIEGTKEAIEEAEAERRRNEAPDIPLDELMDIVKTGGQTEDVQKSLNEITYSMNLLEADLKGIEIDEEV